MSDDLARGVEAYFDQTQRIISQVADLLEDWPTDRQEEIQRFEDLTRAILHASILLRPIANKHVLLDPEPNSPRGGQFINYCKSWCLSAMELSDIGVVKPTIGNVTIANELGPQRSTGFNHLASCLLHLRDCEVRNGEHVFSGGRVLRDGLWRQTPPSAARVNMHLQEWRLMWKVTELAMLFVDLLQRVYEQLKSYCRRYADAEVEGAALAST